MFSRNGKISLRQGFRLFLFDFIGISSLVLLPYLAQTVGMGGVFSIVLGVVWGLIYLLFLYEIHGKMEVDLGTFLQDYVPTALRVAVQLWLILHCVAVSGFAAYLFGVLIKYSLLENESFILIIVMVMAVAAYAISGGIESRARVYELLFWFVLVPLVVMLAAAGTQMEPAYFTGLADVSFLGMLEGSYMVFLFFTTAFWTLFFTKFLSGKQGEDNKQIGDKKQKGAQKLRLAGLQKGIGNKLEEQIEEGTGVVEGFYRKIALAIIISGALLAAAYLVCLGNFGEAALSEMDFPIITLMSSIRIPGNFVKRLDALMIGVWFFTLFAFLNLHLFYGAQVMRDLVGEPQGSKAEDKAYYPNSHKENNRKENDCWKKDNIGKSAGIITAIIVFFSGIVSLIYYYDNSAANCFYGYIYYVGTPLMVVMPLIIYWFGRGRRT